MDPSKYELLRNRTLLFFIEKLIDPPCNDEIEDKPKRRTLHDLSCQFGSKGFTREMRQIAGNSQSGLKKFFLEYPSIFDVDESGLVSYKDTSIRASRNANQSKGGSGATENSRKKDAVEYFRERLIQYGIGVSVPIKSLLGHRSQAPSEVRHIAGQHLEDFRTFLANHPETFTLDEEKNRVCLTEFQNNNEGSCKPNTVLRDNVVHLVEFYGGILQERGPMLVEQLFHIHCQGFTNCSDLKAFFQMHQQCFQVSNSMVTLSDSYNVGVEYLRSSSAMLKAKCKTPEGQHQQQHVQVKKLEPVPKKSSTGEEPSAAALGSQAPQPTRRQGGNQGISSSSSLKSRVSSILLKTLTENSPQTPDLLRSKSLESSSKSLETVLSENDSHDPMVMDYFALRTQIVASTRKAKSVVQDILSSREKPVVAVDTEGVNLGNVESGQVTIVQVALRSGVVFIFDILTVPGIAEELRPLLETESVVKVMHDCRNDSASLYHEHGVRLKGVFDTQAAYVLLQQEDVAADIYRGNSKSVSLNNLCAHYDLKVFNPFKDKMKAVFRQDNRFWSRRPLTKQMLSYAAADVLVLVPYLYDKMARLLESCSGSQKELFMELVDDQIMANITPEEIRQRRRNRKNELDLKVLKKKIEDAVTESGSDNSTSPLVLSNRELRLLKHLELSDVAKEKLKSSLKIARKLEKMERSGSNEQSPTPFAPRFNQDSSSESSEMGSQPHSMEIQPQIDSKFDSLDLLLSAMIDEKSTRTKLDVSTQTPSTGDIVVMNVFNE